MAARNPNTAALNSAIHRSASWLSSENVAKKLLLVMWMECVPKYRPPAMPAALTTASRSTATKVAASSRGSTSRWRGLTAMTSMASSSSRMRREPRSAHMADPPAPAMSRAVATGACSRTTARTMAAPSWDWAPICCNSDPTSRAMTMPKGIDTKMRGSVVTRARNQHWSRNSPTGRPRRKSRRMDSSATANMAPTSRTTLVAFCPTGVVTALKCAPLPRLPARRADGTTRAAVVRPRGRRLWRRPALRPTDDPLGAFVEENADGAAILRWPGPVRPPPDAMAVP